MISVKNEKGKNENLSIDEKINQESQNVDTEEDRERDDLTPELPSELEKKLKEFEERMEKRSEESGESAASKKPNYIEQLEQQVAEKDSLLREYIQEHKESVRRFEEAKGRIRQSITQEVEQSKKNFIAPFLDIIDDFDRALESANGEKENNQFFEGVSMIKERFLKIIADAGVIQFESQGQEFDPNLHEAIGTVPVENEDEDNKVIHIVKQGYNINGELLRPASVMVGKIPS